MSRFLYILAALVVLGVIVMVHEFGHYLIGRLCGIGVVEFSVGMGPKLFSRVIRGTRYSVRCLPLGGFCKFKGEDQGDRSPDAMNAQPVWKRFLTVFAGSGIQFVFAFLLCIVMLHSYTAYELLPRIASVEEGMPAASSGFREGDLVELANGIRLTMDTDGVEAMRGVIEQAAEGEPIRFLVTHADGTREELSTVPVRVERENVDEDGQPYTETVNQIGIAFEYRCFPIGKAITNAGKYLYTLTKTMLVSLKDLIFHGTGVDDMTGPVGLVSVMSETFSEGWYTVIWIALIISLNLGIVNLLPLPALDGGRLVFLLVEAVRGKPVPPEKEGMVHLIGIILLMGLAALITWKDIARLFRG